MKSRVARLLLLVVITVLMLSTISYAANESSLYLAAYTAYISKSGNTVHVNYEVYGTRIMDQVGVTEIYLYEKTSTYGSWTLVQTFLSTDSAYSSSMIGTNTEHKIDSVSYSGSSSYQYMAYVTVYAEKNGGSDSRGIVAN